MSPYTPRIVAQSRTLTTAARSTAASTAQVQSKKKYRETVFSGIQPTGIPHLGNYLGAIQNWLNLQNAHFPTASTSSSSAQTNIPSATILYSIVGLHAITLPQDPKVLRRERKDALACLLACGLGRSRSGQNGIKKGEGPILFFQEDVPEHAELAWYLNTLVGVGKLRRMTTWKSKLSIAKPTAGQTELEEQADEEHLGLGLLAYPVLQAADIMLYKSTTVPVGEDQQQHLELARDIAQSFNSRFGQVFPPPRHVITPSKRILSLTDPTQKMSKSAPNANSRILLTDSPELIVKKIRGAVTDSSRTLSWDPEGRRGVGNLLRILEACEESGAEQETDEEQRMTQFTERLVQSGISSHAELKGLVADRVVEKLRPIREEYLKIRADEGYLSEIAREGRERARELAGRTMTEVRRKVGLDAI